MKSVLFKSILISILAVIVLSLFSINKENTFNYKRESYLNFLKNHPFTNRDISSKELEKIAKHDRPDLAAEQNFLMTFDPELKRVPSERLINSFKDVKKRISKKRKNKGIEDLVWTEKGPNNVGGRTKSIMWDPNDSENKKVWAGSVSGGIWFNNDVTDANSSWQPVNDFLANLAISSLSFDPTNTNIFYAGTGEGFFNIDAGRGAGIFKSEDGGQTWNLLASTQNSDFFYVQKVVVTDDGTVFASTRSNGVAKSTDGGISWTTVLSSTLGNAVSTRSNDIEIAKNGDIYATFGIFTTGRIYKSTNNGDTWADVTPSDGSPQRIEIAIPQTASDNSESTIIYSVASNNSNNIEWFRKSLDGGATWEDLTIPQYREQNCVTNGTDFARGQAWYNLTLQVSPADENLVILGGINVLRSNDGGENTEEVSYWTGRCGEFVHADVHTFAFRPGFPNEVLVGSDGGVSYSTNMGSSSSPSFENRNNNYNVTQFYAVAAANLLSSEYYLAGSQDNGTQRFTAANGMSTTSATGGDGGFTHIDQTDDSFQLTSFTGTNINHSSNGGSSFRTISNSNSGLFINPSDLDNKTHILYSASNSNQISRIENINSNSPTALEVLPLEVGQITHINANAFTDNIIFVGTREGNIYRVSNANGSSPTPANITGNITSSGTISSIAIGDSDDMLLATFSNYGITSVWLTEDGGQNWINKDESNHGLPDIPVRWALFNPQDTKKVLLATELGVWSTQDVTAENPVWEPSSNNLANVRCDMIQYRKIDGSVVVATHGRGLFTSDVFDNTPPTAISFSPADDQLNINFDTDFSIEFSENIFAGSGNIELKLIADNSIFESIDINSSAVNISGNRIEFDLSQDLSPLTDFYFTVSSGVILDRKGNSFTIDNNEVWNFTTLLTPAPSNVLLNQSSKTEIIINWEDNSENETGFNIERSAFEDTGFTEIATLEQNSTSFIDSDYESNKMQFYRIRAESSSSSEFSKTVGLLTIPAPPSTVVISNEMEDGFDINWITPDQADSFQIDISIDDFSSFIDGFNNLSVGSERKLEVRNVEIQNYQIRIRSANISGVSENSETLEVNLITDIKGDVEKISQFNIYPNPVQSTMNLELNRQATGLSLIKIYDLSGQLLFNKEINSSTGKNYKLDVSSFETGVYILEVSNGQKADKKRFLKN